MRAPSVGGAGALPWRSALLHLFLAYLLLDVASGEPNIVYIVADDLDAVSCGDCHMPKLTSLIARQGINFTDATVHFGLCCPSRVSMLAGQCPHNSKIISNYWPQGGARKFIERGLENKTVAYLLQQLGGYRTGLVGKYLNGYEIGGAIKEPELPASYIPPGWERWFGVQKRGYYNWSVSDQGVARQYGFSVEEYSTDVLTQQAVEFVRQSASDPRPFFLYVAPNAPHGREVPAPRHKGLLAGLQVPRSPAFNESDASLAQKVARGLSPDQNPPLTAADAAALDRKYQRRSECMLAVDDMIEALVEALEEVGLLNDTYIVFTSDNGYKLGQRRKEGKQSPYEEDVRVPLLIRGPGVPQGVELPHLIAPTDFLPTFLELAGVEDPYAAERDGRSFAGVLAPPRQRVPRTADEFRIGVLLEMLLSSSRRGNLSTASNATRGGGTSSTAAPTLDPTSLAELCETNPTDELVNGACSHVSELDDPLDFASEAALLRSLVAHQGSWYSPGGSNLKSPGLVLMRAPVNPGPHGGWWVDPFRAVKVSSTAGRYKLIEFKQGYELYDLVQDPYEVNNIYPTAPQGLIDFLTAALDGLVDCQGPVECSVDGVDELRAALQAG